MLDTLKALADPCRLRLTAMLLSGEFTVQELTRIMGMGQSRISRHLKILTEAGILTVKHQGTWSYYRVGEGNGFFGAIRQAFERELESLPERSRDLAAVAAVLEERRRRSQEFFDRPAAARRIGRVCGRQHGSAPCGRSGGGAVRDPAGADSRRSGVAGRPGPPRARGGTRAAG